MPRSILNFNLQNDPEGSREPIAPAAETSAETTVPATEAPAVPVQPVRRKTPEAAATETVSVAQSQPEDPQAKYASAFPAWDLLPPQVLIRRVTRR